MVETRFAVSGGAGKPPTACSKVWATRRHVASSKCLPMIISPAGRPSTRPAGTDVAGWPVTSNGAVLGIISRARAMTSSRGASAGGITLAVIGRVGMTSTS